MVLNSTFDLITRTPLLHLDRISTEGNGKIYAKLEYLQPGGSIKDRAAFQIINDAYSSNRLQKGQTVVEMTSGNMGSGLALVCRLMGNPFIAVMPKGNSPERLKILKAFNAEVVLTDQIDGKEGKVTGKDIQYASSVAKQIAIDKKGFYVDQFNNSSSVKAHFGTTGPEIISDLPNIDAFVSSIGTGGTFVGTSRYLKSTNRNIRCMAVEPENAAILKTGKVIDPKHIIQGTGYSVIPPHWDPDLADEIITVTDAEVLEMTKRLSSAQGLYVGYSSGANVAAALKCLKQLHQTKKSSNKSVNIVTILCDSAYKYSDL